LKDHEVAREIGALIPEETSQVIVLTGMRRTGKSTLLGQLRARSTRGLYINFEDTRLTALEKDDLPRLLEAIEQLAPDNGPLFFDEIQVLPSWEHLIRTLHDRGRRIVVTGSNASLLSRELGTKLTGRHLSYEIYPTPTPRLFRHILRSEGSPSCSGNDPLRSSANSCRTPSSGISCPGITSARPGIS
jgi:predicted AAA+ superfamily ATPase